MKVIRHISTLTAAGTLALAFSGVAFADTANVSTTGADSHNTITINNSTNTNTTNTNEVSIQNVNLQSAQTGDVNADSNTSIEGGLGSGAAVNNASSSTVVAIGNTGTGVVTLPVGGSGGATGGTTPGGTVSGGSGNGGSVLGAAVGGKGSGAVATLPEVGASQAIDVSALRALYRPATSAPTTALVNQSRGISLGLLAFAGFISLMGAIGSVMYAQRKRQA